MPSMEMNLSELMLTVPMKAVNPLAPSLRRDEPAPDLIGGWGEGLLPRIRTRGEFPSHLRCDMTSPRKRGEVKLPRCSRITSHHSGDVHMRLKPARIWSSSMPTKPINRIAMMTMVIERLFHSFQTK